MKNISLKRIIVTGAIFMIIAGSLLHFTYEWSGGNQLVALFSAASESVWEHSKLFLLPLAIMAVIEYIKVRDLARVLWTVLVQLVFMVGFITVFFYTYTGAFGFENVIIDISSFIVAVVLGQMVALHMLKSKSKPLVNKYLSAAALVAIFFMFAVFTFNPPALPIFTQHDPAVQAKQ
ncbi:MAG: DUF6512 family protein [Candidatus Saccharibacteria bacterium]